MTGTNESGGVPDLAGEQPAELTCQNVGIHILSECFNQHPDQTVGVKADGCVQVAGPDGQAPGLGLQHLPQIGPCGFHQPRSVPDLGYPTRKADTKAVKTHSGGHRAAEARQTAEGGCRTRTHTHPPSAAVTPVVPHRHGYASSSLSRFRMPGSTSCRTKSAKTPGIKLSC